MNRLLSLVIAGFLGSAAAAQSLVETAMPASSLETWQADPTTQIDAIDVDLNDFLWLARPVVIFADTPNDPRFAEQIELLQARANELADRDVVILTDTDPSARSDIRTRLRPRGFMLVLIGKDGGVKLRKPSPWDVRELTRVIDKMPLRQQELRERRETSPLTSN